MTRGRISFIVFLLILGLPVLALNFGNFNINGLITQGTGQFTTTATAEPEAPAAPAPVDPYQWLTDRPALRDTFIPVALTDARVITIETIVSTQSLLNDDEEAPADDLLELYAAARAPAQMTPFCAEIVATIGQSCDIIQTLVRQNRDGDWVMDGRLAFLPAAELGDPSVVANGQLFQAATTLPFDGDLRPANDPETRAALLVQAQDICDGLRERVGNCVLTNVDFALEVLWITDLEVLPAGTNPERIDANAAFTVYADEMVWDQAAIDELVTSFADAG